MSSPHRYQAFISYSHTDKRWADWLHKSLESYRVPKRLQGAGALDAGQKKISPIFKDREELATGSSLTSAITSALDDSRCLLVICSPASAKSRWVNEEVLHFRRTGRVDRIFCLVVAGRPDATPGEADDCFAPALRMPIDGTDLPIEPLAADVRPNGDGRAESKIKIAAGILGVGFDELKQRELQRRNRRLVVIATLSVVGMTVAAVLLAATIIARQEADRQRVIAQREAETANQTTEFLVDLFAVVDPSEARGRTVTAHEILERGRTRITTGLKDQPVVRTRLLTTMGRVYTGLGLYDTAVELLRDEDIVGGGVEREVALGAALYFYGDYPASADRFRSAISTLSQTDEQEAVWSRTHSNAYGGLAEALIDLDELDEAEHLARMAIERDQQLWGEDHEQVAKNLSVLAGVLFFKGELDEAQEFYQDALDSHRQNVGVDHPQTLRVLVNLAAVFYLKDQHADSLKFYQQALPGFQKVYGPAHPETASVMNNIGRIYLLRNELDEADRVLTASLEVDRSLGREHHGGLVFTLNSLGLVRLGKNELDEAEQLLTEAHSLARATDHSMLGPIIANSADLECRAAPESTVLEMLDRGRSSIIEHHGAESWRLTVLDSVEGRCRAVLGEFEAGRTQMQNAYDALVARWGPEILYSKMAERRLSMF